MLTDTKSVSSLVKPPDSRVIDPALMRSLREHLEGTEGSVDHAFNVALAQALFDAKVVGDDLEYPGSDSWRDCPPWFPLDDHSPVWHYEKPVLGAAHDHTASIQMTVRFIGIILPQAGYMLSVDAQGGGRAAIKAGGTTGPLRSCRRPPAALLMALLEHLERHPASAAPYRMP